MKRVKKSSGSWLNRSKHCFKMSSLICLWWSVNLLGIHLADTVLMFNCFFNMDCTFPNKMPVSLDISFSTFSWVTYVEGWLEQGSSCVEVRPVLNSPHHLVTVEYGVVDFPNVSIKHWKYPESITFLNRDADHSVHFVFFSYRLITSERDRLLVIISVSIILSKMFVKNSKTTFLMN